MKIRKFTRDGSAAFQALIVDAELIRTEPEEFINRVNALVSDEKMTNVVGDELQLKPINDRLEFAEYIYDSIQSQISTKMMADLTGDKHFWNWMAAYWLETLVKADGRSELIEMVGKSEDGQRWILVESKTRFHRHLVSGPYFAYQANANQLDRAMVLFAKFPNRKNGNVLESGELWERLAGKTSLSSGNILFLATLLFYDSDSKLLRPNAGNKKNGAQAFSIYFSQLDLTLDYESMETEYLLKMLPKHLQRWVPDAKKEIPRQESNGKIKEQFSEEFSQI